jgi:shikimate 5-dehydrogenase
VFAVLAGRAATSLSPAMHNAAFAALGLPNLFVPLSLADPAELDLLLCPTGETALDDAGLSAGGFAVTMPFKAEAARRCTLLAPRAARAGVANTVLPRHEKVLGDCTDIDGITRVLAEEGVDLTGRLAVVLGTGGAARAALVAVELAGASAGVIGRDAARAAALASELDAAVVAPADISRAAVFINATPAGIAGGDEELLSTLGLAAGTVVIDLPYGNSPTTLERLAPAHGWRYISGREVLLFQGVSQFAAMNGVAPPVRAMAAALGLEEVQG